MANRQNFDARKKSAVQEARPDSTRRRVAATVVDDIRCNVEDELFAILKAAVLNPDPQVCRKAVRSSVTQGTRPEDLADFYIPAIARDLGDLWCEDQLGFANVTIGVSRLQAMMRELGPNWASDNASNPAAPSILLIVLQDVYHTLGAIVLTSQLRRKGYSVKLLLGSSAEVIAQRILRTTYNCVFISSSRGETLESLRRVIDAMKTSMNNPPPVVVGGSILEVETEEDITALTGADYATRIPSEALRLCGLQDMTLEAVRANGGT
ncbi:B12-binding domain-containing protein [Yoonia sp.]|uniref:cobalamin B12-binding domain-containing protein n=1 Tax=Yoonia sp. TaxID=2212373 RepID=UPI0039747C49